MATADLQEALRQVQKEIHLETWLLFNCIFSQFPREHWKDLALNWDAKRDFVQLIAHPESAENIQFKIDVYRGLVDFFIDFGKEVFIQHRFKSKNETGVYFETFFRSEVQCRVKKTKEGKTIREEYVQSANGRSRILSASINVKHIWPRPSLKLEKTFARWKTAS